MSANQKHIKTTLPSLPGYSVKQPNKPKIVKAFQVVNGVRIEKSPLDSSVELRDGIPHSLKTSSNRKDSSNTTLPAKDPTTASYYGINRQAKDRELYDDPKSSVTKPLPYSGGVPSSVPFLTENNVFKFNAFFTEDVYESPGESFRVRKADIYYYAQDDTMHIEEPKVENSGLPQGQYRSRSKISNPNSAGDYKLSDLRVGGTVETPGRVFFIVDCDNPTRARMEALGLAPQPDALPVPTGEYDATIMRQRATRGGDPSQNYGKQLTSMKYFMEAALGQNVKASGNSNAHGNKILRFYLAWDNRSELYGKLSTFSLLYYMYDKTTEIVEDKTPDSGLDQFPKLLGRKKLPKVHQGEIYNDADRGVEAGAPPGTYYEERDFKIGERINLWGRSMQIIGCDVATKAYYQQAYGMADDAFTSIDVSEPPPKTYPRVPPPHTTGIGSEEDSLASWLHLHPKKPFRDLKKLYDFDGKELHFQAVPLNGPAVKQERTFSLKFFLMDDTIGVYDVPVKNSGVVPGCFLRRSKFKVPDNSRYYEASDFKVGATIEIVSHKFKLTYADEYTRDFINGVPEPPSTLTAGQLTETMKFKLWQKNKSLGFLREAFRHVDENSDSKISLEELKKYLQDSCCRGERLDDNAAMEVFNFIDTNKDRKLDFNEFCEALAEGSKLNMTCDDASGSVINPSEAAPVLRTIATALKSDSRLFHKLLSRQVIGNTDIITSTVLRDGLFAVSRHFDLNLRAADVRLAVAYLFPGGEGNVTTSELYDLLKQM